MVITQHQLKVMTLLVLNVLKNHSKLTVITVPIQHYVKMDIIQLKMEHVINVNQILKNVHLVLHLSVMMDI